MFPTWVYIAVALAIALVAFGIAQLAPGLGIWFAIPASLMWTAWSVKRQRRIERGG